MARLLSAAEYAVKQAANVKARKTGLDGHTGSPRAEKPAKSRSGKPQGHVKRVPTVDYPAMLQKQIGLAAFPIGTREYRFDANRKWRFDLAWPTWKIALEVDGGIWSQGRHTRGGGYLKDMEKLNSATLQGWRVLRTTPDAVKMGRALELVEWAFKYLRG